MTLLTDINRCPCCGRTGTIRFDQRRCVGCMTRVLRPDDNWRLLKEDWIISGWVFFPANSAGNFRGWIYQTHLDNPQPAIEVKPVTLPDSKYNSVAKTKGSSAEHTPEALGVKSWN